MPQFHTVFDSPILFGAETF